MANGSLWQWVRLLVPKVKTFPVFTRNLVLSKPLTTLKFYKRFLVLAMNEISDALFTSVADASSNRQRQRILFQTITCQWLRLSIAGLRFVPSGHACMTFIL